MARLIDADAIDWDTVEYEYGKRSEPIVACEILIENQTTIDAVSVVRGEWICHEGKWIDFDYYPTKYECSQCHHYVDVASDKKFCPNCGAMMKGADDE